MNFHQATGETFKANGYDPKWIEDDEAREGPYAAIHIFNEACPCCGHDTDGWTVIYLITATGIGQTYFGDNAQCDASENAQIMNAAWRMGNSHSGSDS